MRVDFAAVHPHCLARLLPMWELLDEEERGQIFGARGIQGRERGRVGLAASYRDARSLRSGHQVTLLEHGIGEFYLGNDHQSYIRGRNREFIDFYLALRPGMGEEPCAVVGDIYLDQLDRLPAPQPEFDVAISFHADYSAVCPEAGSTVDYWLPAVRKLIGDGVRVLGHGHPRDRNAAIRWRRLGVEFEPSFEQCLLRAATFAVDNSSSMFYAAALNVPVIVMNAPWYRREDVSAYRFWRMADIGVQVETYDELQTAVDGGAGKYRFDHADHIAGHVMELFPLRDGQAAHRAVAALRERYG